VPRFGIWNPPEARLAELCAAQPRVFLRLAALAPRVRFTGVRGRGSVELQVGAARIGSVSARVEVGAPEHGSAAPAVVPKGQLG
jgi:hypothetical protein